MKGKNDTMAKRILENGEIKDKKKINKSRIAGMTLIALVVTIIVIIILATVGITIGLGSGGVIEKAEVSKDIVKLSEYGTTIKMITANEYTNKMSNEKTGELKELVKNTLKKDEKWVKDVEDVKGDENKIKVITVEDYIIVAQIWDDGDLDIINAGKDNEEPYPVISIGQEVVDENTIKLKVIADVTTTDKTKGIDTVTFVNTGDAIKNYNKGDVLTFNVTKSGKYTFEAVTNMGKTTRQSVVVKIKSSEADIQIASEPTTSRNTLKTGKLNGVDAGPIEVNIDYGYTKLLKQYKLGEDGTWTNVDSQNVKLKVTDNMTVYARYFDGESKEVKLTSYDVANVDNIAPNAFGITATSTSNSITVNASTIDTANKGAKVGISGVKEYLYRIFRNESWGEWQSSKQFTDLPEGEYKVQAKAIDKAGNETISSNVVTLECKLQRAEVTFDNNDGSDKKQTVSKVVGTELGELPTVSREGYDFAGWYTDKTSGTKVTENTVVPETDVTYYARWTARNDTKYTVIHQQMNLDGTTYTTVDTEELKGKTDSKVTPDVKSYEGFTAPEKQEVTIKADGSTTVTYKYTRNKYTLTYNPNGGSVSPTSIKADYDAEITLPTPTRKYTITYNTNGGSSVTNSTVDYTFNGWYTKASEGDKRTYTKMPAYNETLYAQWASSGIALPTTNKAGYVLAGWYTDSALTSEVTLSDGKYIPTANITLYAKWEEVVITLNPMSFTYDGTEKKPETTVKVGSKTLEKDKDYTVEYKNNINVGTATVTITGKGSYEGVTATTTFKINEKRITIPAGKTLTYNGEEQTGVDSKDEYKFSGTIKATNAGTYSATATLTDTANTKWSDETTEAKTISWKINAKKLSGNVTVSDVEDKTYTGSAITPEVEVKDTARNTVLTKNKDYTISYKNNVNAGTATITITGKGNYTGTVEKTFKIVKASVVVPTQNGTLTYNGSSQSPKWNNYNTNLMTIGGTTSGTNAGNYNATFTLKDKTNYQWNGGTTDDKTVEWRIGQRENTISVAGKTLTYNGREQVLVTVSSAQGTVYYSIGTALTSSNYKTAGSTEMPKATNANTEGYKVYYYCEGDINNKAKSGNVTAKINKATNPMGVTNKTVYAGSITDLTTAVVGAQGNVTFELTSSGTTTASTLSGSNLTAGTLSTTDDNTQTVVIKVTAAGNDNYNEGSKNLTITVQKYTAGLSWTTTTPSNIIYGTTGKSATVNVIVAGGTKGKITYTSGSTDVLEIDASTGALTTKKVGSSEITASIARTSTVKPATTKKTITVVQNTNPITATGKTLTYNGKDQELITVSNAQGDVYYSVGTVLSNSNYQTAGSTTIPTKKDANVNGYVVYYYCVGNKNYSAKAGSVTTKINKANLTITADNKTMTYGGTVPTYTYTGTGFVNGETASVLGGTASYTVKNSSGTAVTISKTTNAGTYTITPSGLSSNNYNITYKAGTLTIGQETNPITVTNKTVYTGSTTDLSTLVSNAQGTITYKVKTNGTTTASTLSGSKLTAGAMSAENDNNQTVVVTVTAGGNTNYASGSKDLTITVQKYTPTLAWTSTTPSSIVYGTTGKTATVTATVSGGTKGAVTYTSGTTGVLTINSSTGALTTAGVGSSTITASIARTTTVKAGSTARTISVTKATNPITVTGNTLTYNGKAQNLVTTAKAQGAVYYSVGTSLTSSNYTTAGSTTIPTQTSANTSGYVVYYYCVGNGNYNAKSGNVTVKIAKAASVNPTLTDVSVPYDTKAHAISVSGGSGGTIYYRTSTDNSTWGSWTTTKPTRTSVGTTYVQAYVKGDSNHSDTSATASKKITIQTSYWKNTTKGTYYATTASAISAAAANDTLELQRNFTDAGTVSINKTLYIDLSSYTWTKTTSTITITSAGMVYLGADKGKITTSGAFNLITNAGKFYLGGPNTFSGSLTRTNASSDYSVVYNTGTYSQASTSTVITSTGIGIYNNGGDVSIQTGTIDANYHAIKNHAGTLEINGGGVTITGNKGTDVTWSAVCNDEGATMTLKSGTITGSNHQGISNYGTCTISGGTVKSGKASNAITNQSTGKVTITGGTISTTTGYAIRSLSTQTAAVSVSGGTVTSSTTNGTILNEASGTVTLSGGTITNTNGTSGSTYSVVKNISTGRILISGATVQKQGNGAIVYNTSTGTIQMNSGTIKAVTNAGYGIYSTSTGAVTMSGGTISSVINGIDAKGNITVRGGTIRATVGAIYQRGAGKTVTIGTSASTSASSPEIYGTVQGIYATDTNGVTIYCYSGKIGVGGSTGNPVINNNGTTIIGSQVANKTKSPTIVFCSNNSDSNTPVVDTGTLVYYSGTIGSVGGKYYGVSSVSHIPLMFKSSNFVNETSGECNVTYYGGTNNKNMSVAINGQTYYMGPYNSLTYTK